MSQTAAEASPHLSSLFFHLQSCEGSKVARTLVLGSQKECSSKMSTSRLSSGKKKRRQSPPSDPSRLNPPFVLFLSLLLPLVPFFSQTISPFFPLSFQSMKKSLFDLISRLSLRKIPLSPSTLSLSSRVRASLSHPQPKSQIPRPPSLQICLPPSRSVPIPSSSRSSSSSSSSEMRRSSRLLLLLLLHVRRWWLLMLLVRAWIDVSHCTTNTRERGSRVSESLFERRTDGGEETRLTLRTLNGASLTSNLEVRSPGSSSSSSVREASSWLLLGHVGGI